MFDYSLDKYSKKDFIINFTEDGDTINVHLANGDEYPVPNTKENKNNLITAMEEQVNDSWRYVEKKKKDKRSARNWIIYDAVFLAFNAVMAAVNPTVWTWVAIGCFVLAGSSNIFTYYCCKKDLEDVEKNQIFLRNKEKINEYLNRGNEEVKEDTLNPVKEEENSVSLNINDIHDMSKSDVDKILSDINRDEKFNIDRPKVLTKRYIGMKNGNK